MQRCDAYEFLLVAMVEVERTWTAPTGQEGLGHVLRDAIHHVCHALAVLDDARAGDTYETIGDGPRVLAHEAYYSLVALAQELARAVDSAAVAAVARACAAVDMLLDTLAPFVTGADRALRGCSVDGIAFELALDGLETLDLGDDRVC
jgi:hypothetical protein